MSTQQFCLRWNNHQPNFISVFTTLLNNESLVDVTLAAEGRHLQAHKVVLSACSVYFQTLFTANPSRHPIVILKDVKYTDLRTMVDFMYYGEVNVSQEQLPQVLETAKMLKIKGLTEMPDATFTHKSQSTSTDRADLVPTGDHSGWGEQQKGNIPCNMSPSVKRKRVRKTSTCNSVLTMYERSTKMDDKVTTVPDAPTTCSSDNLVKTDTITLSSVSSVPNATKTKQQMLTVKDSQFMMMQKHSLEDAGIEIVMPESDDTPDDCILHNVDNSMVTESASDMTMQGPQWTMLDQGYQRYLATSCQGTTVYCSSAQGNTKIIQKNVRNMKDSIPSTVNRHSKVNMVQETLHDEPLQNQLSSSILFDMPIIQSVESLQHRDIGSTMKSKFSPSALDSKRISDLACSQLVKLAQSAKKCKKKSRPSVSMTTSNESLNFSGLSDLPLSSPNASVSTNNDDPKIKESFKVISMSEVTGRKPVAEKASNLKLVSGELGHFQSRPRSSSSPEKMPAPRLPAKSRLRQLAVHAFNKPSLPKHPSASKPGATHVSGIIRLRSSSLDLSTSSTDDTSKTRPDKIDEDTEDKYNNQEDVFIESDVLVNAQAQISEFQQISETERKEHCPATRLGPPLSCNFCWNTVDADGRTLRRKTKYHCPECKANLCMVPCFHQFHDMNTRR